MTKRTHGSYYPPGTFSKSLFMQRSDSTDNSHRHPAIFASRTTEANHRCNAIAPSE